MSHAGRRGHKVRSSRTTTTICVSKVNDHASSKDLIKTTNPSGEQTDDEFDQFDSKLWSGLHQYLVSPGESASTPSSHTLSLGVVSAQDLAMVVDGDELSSKISNPSSLTKSSLTSLVHNESSLSTSPEPGTSSSQGLSDPTSICSDVTLQHLPDDLEMNSSLVLGLGVAGNPGMGPDLATISSSSPGETVDSELDWEDWLPEPTSEAPVAVPLDKPQDTLDESVQFSEPALTLSNRPTKRKLSFGRPQLVSDDRARMPPPALRTNLRCSGSEVLDNFLKSDILGSPINSVHYRDLAKTTDEVSRIGPATPSTPRFLEAIPPSPVLVGDSRKHCYPKITGLSNLLDRPVEIPLPETYLDELRRRTDPHFSNDEYWADELYFPDEAYAFKHFDDSRTHPYQKQDWSTIWRALQREAGGIPIPTSEEMTENVFHLLGNRMGRTTIEDAQKMEVENMRHIKTIRPWFDTLGVAWSLVRRNLPVDSKVAEAVTGSPIADPDQIVCDEDFQDFGRSATFLAGRALARPDPEDTAGVFSYARSPVVRPISHPAGTLPERQQPPTRSLLMQLSGPQRACGGWPFAAGSGGFRQQMGPPGMSMGQTSIPSQWPTAGRCWNATSQAMPAPGNTTVDYSPFTSLPADMQAKVRTRLHALRARVYASRGQHAPAAEPLPDAFEHFWGMLQAREAGRQAGQMQGRAPGGMLAAPRSQPFRSLRHMMGGQRSGSGGGSSSSILGRPFQTP